MLSVLTTMSDAEHSLWSASGFEALMLCPGKRRMERGKPDNTNIYSAEGTAAHAVLKQVLDTGQPAADFVGTTIATHGIKSRDFDIVVDADMADYVQQVADFARQLAGDDGVMLTEQRVNYAYALGVPAEDAWGTADIVILRGDRITVIDLKYGRGVEVLAERNPQLMLYGLGALGEHDGLVGEFREVELIIAQPRISREPKRWTVDVPDLLQWAQEEGHAAVVQVEAAETADRLPLVPGEKQCKFCKAKAECPALRSEVSEVVSASPATVDEFERVTDPTTFDELKLSRAMSAVGLIEDWCTGVRAEVERRLLAGAPVTGYKLVEGKLGNRSWTDPKEVESVLKGMRLKQDEMYDLKLISPTTAEKLLAKDSPRRWTKLQSLISRAPGKPSVAPITDKRPALEIKPVADDFAVVESIDDLT